MKDMPQLSISPPEEDEAFRERIIAGESVIDYMDIYSQPGTRILFHNKGGYSRPKRASS